MSIKKIKKVTEMGKACPVRNVLDHIGNKWSINIIYALRKNGALRFGELHYSVDGISQKMLTNTLKLLTEDGLIDRKMYPEIPPKVEYRLTSLGEDLAPLLEALINWAENNVSILENNQP